MKKLLLVATVALASGSLCAQNEYFQHNPEWTTWEVYYGNCRQTDTVTYYLNGDTLINSLTYKKIYARGTSQNTWWGPGPIVNCNLTPYNYPETGYVGAIRSAGLQIYFIHSAFSNEDMIYDFNLSVGDSVPTCAWTTPNPMDDTIAFIDSVYTPYGYLKKFHFASDTMLFVGEGGFSDFGLFAHVGIQVNGTSQLECYSLNDSSWYPQQGPNCDAILLGTSDLLQPGIAFQLLPNPATEYVDVVVTGAQIDLVEVHDALGKKVISQRASRINTSRLESGIYFVRVISGENVVTEKLLVE